MWHWVVLIYEWIKSLESLKKKKNHWQICNQIAVYVIICFLRRHFRGWNYQIKNLVYIILRISVGFAKFLQKIFFSLHSCQQIIISAIAYAYHLPKIRWKTSSLVPRLLFLNLLKLVSSQPYKICFDIWCEVKIRVYFFPKHLTTWLGITDQ